MSEEKNNINSEEEACDTRAACDEDAAHEEELTSTDEVAFAEDDSASVEEQSEATAAQISEGKVKKKRSVSLRTYLLSTVAIILATLMLTYSVCAELFRKQYLDSVVKGDTVDNEDNVSSLADIDLLNSYIDKYFYGEVDKEAMMAAALKAYIAATGDIYAAYYTVDELLANYESSAGRMCGVGINIVNAEFDYNGQKTSCLQVINVMDDSPAQKAGILKGDRLIYVGIDENKQSVTELGYDKALELLLGEEGTIARFVIARENGEGYEEIAKEVTRATVQTTSVMSSVVEKNSDIGILKIIEFDYTTPKQFEKKLEALKEQGCTKFVIDLRYNPGGLLVSIEAVLSYFLNENDIYIQTKDSKGNVEKRAITPVTYENADASLCNVEKEKIGKYKDLDMVVLCNGSTASAAELFVANFKDYGLGKIVGVNTFGKGKMQDTFPLNYGLSGAVKLTTHMYFSGGDKEHVGYDGVGITPDVIVPLDEKAMEYHVYLLPQELDNQLMVAVDQFN